MKGLKAFFVAAFALVGCASRGNNETRQTSDRAGESERTTALTELPKLQLNASALDSKDLGFISHAGGQAYFALNVPAAPVKALIAPIEKRFGEKLRNRGEAHITVLTPGEAGALAKAGLPMSAIDRAFGDQIQQARFVPICVGRGGSKKDARLHTYYIVVESPDLLALRKKILAAASEKAESGKVEFDPSAFFPHVTIGFTDRDLHLESDGLRKDVNTCAFGLDMD